MSNLFVVYFHMSPKIASSYGSVVTSGPITSVSFVLFMCQQMIFNIPLCNQPGDLPSLLVADERHFSSTIFNLIPTLHLSALYYYFR